MNTYNLLYNLSLVKVNPILYFNIFNLLRYIDKFNGKKIINVNYIDESFAKEFVEKTFKNISNVEFHYTDNDQTNGWYELTPFMTKLLPSVYSLNDNEYTFYGHTKGITRYNHETEFVCLLWAHTMYTKNLDNFEYISNILKDYACCGTFKLDRPYTALAFVPWHYSGAFFWFKNKTIFSRQWRQFYPNLYGLEGYLATHCSSSEAYSIPPELPEGFEQIYLKKNWEHFYKI